MNTELNLCEILKGHEGETFHSPLYGNVTLEQILGRHPFPLVFDTENSMETFTSDGRFYDIPNSECLIFPSKEQRDWNKWIEEQKPKTPKTWSELTKVIHDSWAIYVYEENAKTPIEKSAIALLKIHQLIEVGYGGNITDEEYSKPIECYYIQYSGIDKKFGVYRVIDSKFHIAFHTQKQADEFLSYPENIQLLKDYFML